MRKLVLLMLGMAALALLSAPPVAQAQLSEAINLTNQGVEELTDWPAQGGRHKVDINKIGGADIREGKKAGALFQDALAKARSGNASRMAIFKLEEAVVRAPEGQHKDARLMAQGALFYLCKDNGGKPEETCNKVPKYGSYTSP
jgi:hypothetical protein